VSVLVTNYKIFRKKTIAEMFGNTGTGGRVILMRYRIRVAPQGFVPRIQVCE